MQFVEEMAKISKSSIWTTWFKVINIIFHSHVSAMCMGTSKAEQLWTYLNGRYLFFVILGDWQWMVHCLKLESNSLLDVPSNYLWTHSNGISLIFHPRELVICLSWNIIVLWMVVVFCYLDWCNEIAIGCGEGEQGYLESCIWKLFFCCGTWFYVEDY
jgi:hypothetical protein